MWRRGKTVSSSKLDSSDREEEEEEEEEERGGTSHLSLRAFNKLSLSPLLFRHSGPRKRKRGKSLFLPLPASWLSTLKEASWGLHRSAGGGIMDGGRRGKSFFFTLPFFHRRRLKSDGLGGKCAMCLSSGFSRGGRLSLSRPHGGGAERGGRHRLSVAGD